MFFYKKTQQYGRIIIRIVGEILYWFHWGGCGGCVINGLWTKLVHNNDHNKDDDDWQNDGQDVPFAGEGSPEH
jgi:hypothetical protein